MPISNSNCLTKCLENLILNPDLIEEYGKKSRKIYLDNFKFEKMAINTEKVYIDILGQNKN